MLFSKALASFSAIYDILSLIEDSITVFYCVLCLLGVTVLALALDSKICVERFVFLFVFGSCFVEVFVIEL